MILSNVKISEIMLPSWPLRLLTESGLLAGPKEDVHIVITIGSSDDHFFLLENSVTVTIPAQWTYGTAGFVLTDLQIQRFLLVIDTRFTIIYARIVKAEIFVGDQFSWEATPTIIKPTKICTHEELATLIMVGYAHQRKFITSKI